MLMYCNISDLKFCVQTINMKSCSREEGIDF